MAPSARAFRNSRRPANLRSLRLFGFALTVATDQIRLDAEKEMDKVLQYFGSEQDNNPSTTSSTTTCPTLWTTRQEANAFIDNELDAILFDCDGVLYRSPDQAPGAGECVQSLLDKGKKVFFVTNNAASNRMQLRDKLNSILQIDTLTEEMMVSSSYSCAQYLKQKFLDPQNKGSSTGRVFVIGSEGLCEELRKTGFEVLSNNSEENNPSMSRDELADYGFPEHPIDAVVVGHDTAFSFRKLSIANVLLQRNPNAPLVATNLDAFDLVGADARHIPGNGCVVKALEHSSGRQAVNVGKPSKTLIDLIAAEHGLDPARSLIVGDRLDTDIQFGVESGMYSALVMTGVTTAEQLKDIKDGVLDEPLPSIILPYVGLMA